MVVEFLRVGFGLIWLYCSSFFFFDNDCKQFAVLKNFAMSNSQLTKACCSWIENCEAIFWTLNSIIRRNIFFNFHGARHENMSKHLKETKFIVPVTNMHEPKCIQNFYFYFFFESLYLPFYFVYFLHFFRVSFMRNAKKMIAMRNWTFSRICQLKKQVPRNSVSSINI